MGALNMHPSKFLIEPRVEDYLEGARRWLFPDTAFLEHELYGTLVHFVLHEEAPLFFSVDAEKERSAFTTPYLVVPVPRPKGKYENPTFFSLANLHEFVHSLFPYPRSVAGLTSRLFDEHMMRCEAVASNATEVLVHYDLPAVRERLRRELPVIWFDVLSARFGLTRRPSVAQLLEIRRAWLKSDAFDWLFCQGPGFEAVGQFMARWRNGNEVYWHKRLAQLLRLPDLHGDLVVHLDPLTYENQLREYRRERLAQRRLTQERYEQLLSSHARVLYAIQGRPDRGPKTFEELCLRREEMNEFLVHFDG